MLQIMKDASNLWE